MRPEHTSVKQTRELCGLGDRPPTTGLLIGKETAAMRQGPEVRDVSRLIARRLGI